MAKKISENRKLLLSFSEVKNTIEMSYGSKKGKSDNDSISFQKHQERILKGIELLCEFLMFDPSKIIEEGRKATKNTSIMSKMIVKMEEFRLWLISEKGFSINSAKTIRGNSMSIFKWAGIRIPTKNTDSISNKAKRNQELGIDLAEQKEIVKKMFAISDLEMKCYISLSLACGHRISDIIAIDLKTINCLINKDLDYIHYIQIDKKSNSKIELILGRLQQFHLKNYIETINDDRIFLFGGKNEEELQKVENRIRKNFFTKERQITNSNVHIVVPHTLRALFETIIINHGFEKTQAYIFSGHKSGEKYIQLTKIQMINIFKAIENDINLDNIVLKNNSKTEIQQETIQKLVDMLNNEGKTNSLVQISTNEEKMHNLSEEEKLDVNIANFISSFKKSIIDSIKTQLKF